MKSDWIAKRYQVAKYLRSLNEGEWYEALDKMQDRAVIMRTMNLSRQGEVGPGVEHLADRKLRTQMENEQRILDRLNHPNILSVVDRGIDGATYYIVYDHFESMSLADVIYQKDRPSIKLLLRYAIEIATTLAYLHGIGVYHCDIKPDNILIIDDRCQLIEFIIANHDRLDKGITGTIPYLSPEAIQGASPASSQDIWSFGVTLYEMLTRQLPFGGASPPDVFREIFTAPIPSVPKHYPTALEQLLQKMLERDLDERIASAQIVSNKLQDILNNLTSDQ